MGEKARQREGSFLRSFLQKFHKNNYSTLRQFNYNQKINLFMISLKYRR